MVGFKGHITPEESVRLMLLSIDKADKSMTGTFIHTGNGFIKVFIFNYLTTFVLLQTERLL